MLLVSIILFSIDLVLVAAAAMSMFLLDVIGTGYKKDMKSIIEEAPNINAASSFAMILNLINPLKFFKND